MINVLLIGLSANLGGVENYLVNYLRSADHQQLRFFVPNKGQKIIFQEELSQLGVHFVKTPTNRHNPFKYFSEWHRIFQKMHFSAVYLNTCDTVSIDFLKLARMYKVPRRIIHSHCTSYTCHFNRIHKLIGQWNKLILHRYATHFCACSKNAGEWMFGNNRKFQIIHNAIDTAKFKFVEEHRQAIRSQLGLGESFTMGFVGRFSPQKKIIESLEIFQEVKHLRPNAKYLFIGSGSLYDEAVKKTSQLGLQDDVLLLGRRTDISELMSAMDVFILPSNFEGFPYVMVEAQAAGLPCVVSDVITSETNITGEVQYVSNQLPPSEWARIITTIHCQQPRENYPNILCKQGYDTVENARTIDHMLGAQ